MPKLPRGAGKATTKERAKKPAAKRAATKTSGDHRQRSHRGHEDHAAPKNRGREDHAPAKKSNGAGTKPATTGRSRRPAERRTDQDAAAPRPSRRPPETRLPPPPGGPPRATTRRPVRRPSSPTTSAVLLGDLFAVVEEHSGEAAEEIDRDLVERAFVFSCERHADQRRASGEDFITHPVGVAKICAGMRLDTATLCAALLHDTVEDTSASLDEVHRGVRRGDRPARGRPDEAVGRHLPEPRRPPGGELPEDDGRDGPRHPGHPHQARRPPPQHADDRLDAEVEAAREGARDARDLRPARAPARHPRDQVGARGPRVPHAPPAQVQRDQAAGLAAARGARRLRGARRRVPAGRS